MLVLLFSVPADRDRNTSRSPAARSAVNAPDVHDVVPAVTVQPTSVEERPGTEGPRCRTNSTSTGGATSSTTRRPEAVQLPGAMLSAPSGVVVSGPNGLKGLV